MHYQKVVRYRIALHTVFWLFYMAIAFVVATRLVALEQAALRTVLAAAIMAGGMYTLFLYLLPRFYQKGKYAGFALRLVLVVFTLLGLRIWTDYELLWKHGTEAGMPILSSYAAIVSVVSSIVLFAVGWGYWFGEQAYLSQMRSLEIERQKVQVERDFLRSQVNPHMLFNTLNNIYSLALKNSKTLPEVILKLSELMRYMLYDAAKESVLLTDELEYLHNYIELQQLKTPHKQDISFTAEGETEGITMPPMLYVSLLENALKHSDVQQSGWITMHLIASPTNLHFTIKNSVLAPATTQPTTYGGLGLENLRKRLQLLFPNQHTFILEPAENTFSATLSITLP